MVMEISLVIACDCTHSRYLTTRPVIPCRPHASCHAARAQQQSACCIQVWQIHGMAATQVVSHPMQHLLVIGESPAAPLGQQVQTRNPQNVQNSWRSTSRPSFITQQCFYGLRLMMVVIVVGPRAIRMLVVAPVNTGIFALCLVV